MVDEDRQPVSTRSVMADGGSTGWLHAYEDGRDSLVMTYRDLSEDWDYTVEAELVAGKPTLVALSVDQKDPAKPVPLRRAALRQLPLGTLIDRAKATLQKEWSARVGEAMGGVRKPARQGKSWPDNHYLQVSWYYNRAQILGIPPRQAVAAEWGVSEVTASRWIAKARRLGHLDPYDASAPRTSPRDADPYLGATESVEKAIFKSVLTRLIEQGQAAGQDDQLVQLIVDGVLGRTDSARRVRRRIFEEHLLSLAEKGDAATRQVAINLIEHLIDRGDIDLQDDE